MMVNIIVKLMNVLMKIIKGDKADEKVCSFKRCEIWFIDGGLGLCPKLKECD